MSSFPNCDARDAFQTVLQSGYSNVAILDGGFAAWTRGPLPAREGAAGERVSYICQPVKGSVAEELRRLVASGKAVVLNVREDDEFGSAQILSACSRPRQAGILPSVEGFLDFLPKGTRSGWRPCSMSNVEGRKATETCTCRWSASIL